MLCTVGRYFVLNFRIPTVFDIIPLELVRFRNSRYSVSSCSFSCPACPFSFSLSYFKCKSRKRLRSFSTEFDRFHPQLYCVLGSRLAVGLVSTKVTVSGFRRHQYINREQGRTCMMNTFNLVVQRVHTVSHPEYHHQAGMVSPPTIHAPYKCWCSGVCMHDCVMASHQHIRCQDCVYIVCLAQQNKICRSTYLGPSPCLLLANSGG